ncbi:MAG TPA: molybdate ABC transporter permease subunit [Candidatus Kapabacteria bacterium]|nr:molybdate ABC transporter permease subunit [Candidatus Kapabacteria bacterium]
MGTPDISPLWVSAKVALVAAVLVLVLGTIAAWRLARSNFRGKALLETILTLPLILPPTVVGYYLLVVFGRGTAWGRWLNDFAGIRVLFTWEGAAIAAAIMSFPLMVKTAAAAMESIEREYIETARTSGATEWQIFRHVYIPLSYKGILAGAVLAFARGLGEFGATLMVAGNIPGRTQTLPLALYNAVQSGNDNAALLYTIILTITGFAILWGVQQYQQYLSTARAEK